MSGWAGFGFVVSHVFVFILDAAVSSGDFIFGVCFFFLMFLTFSSFVGFFRIQYMCKYNLQSTGLMSWHVLKRCYHSFLIQ